MERSRFISSIIAVVILVGSVWLFVSHVRSTPEHVFTDMLRNNVSTSGVIRVVSQDGQNVQVNQYTQLSLGAQPQAHSLTVLQQGSSKLATEEISTAKADLVRYQSIKLPGASSVKFAKLVGKWAKLDSSGSSQAGLTSGLFGQALLGTLPIANLAPADQQKILATIQKYKVFGYDPKAVRKAKLNGVNVYRYDVSINSSAYVIMMQQFEKLIGQKTFASVKPETYAEAGPINIQVDINTESHQLAQVYQVSNQRTERYEGFGITDTTPLPKATLTTTQLTKQLAGLSQ